MNILKLIILGIIFIGMVHYMLYSTTTKNKIKSENSDDNESINISDYSFENYINLENSSRKKIFIHIPYEKNERAWKDFYGRSSNDLNLDLSILCIKSIIQKCSYDHDIILYNNNNVKYLIKEKNENDLCNVQNPEILSGIDLSQWENYCKAKILYKFGGIIMEPYFFFHKVPSKNILFPNSFHALTNVNEGLHRSQKKFIPTTNYFMGCPKQDKDMKLYLKYLEYLCVNQYSIEDKHFNNSS